MNQAELKNYNQKQASLFVKLGIIVNGEIADFDRFSEASARFRALYNQGKSYLEISKIMESEF